MAKILFFEHHESSAFAARLDVAVFINGFISSVFTIYVENGNTVGALNKPFVKGDSLEEIWQKFADFNIMPEGAVCLCGSSEEYHCRSAACDQTSCVTEIDPKKAIEYSGMAKRLPVGLSLFKIAWRALRDNR